VLLCSDPKQLVQGCKGEGADAAACVREAYAAINPDRLFWERRAAEAKAKRDRVVGAVVGAVGESSGVRVSGVGGRGSGTGLAVLW